MYVKWQDNATTDKAPVAVPDWHLSASCVQFVFLKKPFSKGLVDNWQDMFQVNSGLAEHPQ